MNKVFEFDSWLSFVDAAENGRTDNLANDWRVSRGNGNSEWAGTDSFEEAIKLAKEGWPEGAKRVGAKLELLYSHLPTKKRIPEFAMSMVGPGTLDMQRYLIGHPAPWITWQETDNYSETSGRIIAIAFSISTSAGVSKEAMFSKGALICALVDMLERANIRVELFLTFGSSRGRDVYISAKVLVKRANDPLDIDRTTFVLAHAACFRRLGFSILEQAPKELRKEIGVLLGGGYGQPFSLEVANAINIKESSLYDETYNEEKQTQWLREQLLKYGVEWRE